MTKFICVMIMIVHTALAGDNKPCCSQSSTGEFALFGKDLTFVALHADPIPFHYQSAGGEMRTLKIENDNDANMYVVQSPQKTDNYLFIFHEWWGLNDYIKRESEKLQHELGNVNVVALDLYEGKIAGTSDSARKYVGEVNEDRARSIIKAAISFAGSKSKIATLGWCFGGGWSMQATLMLERQAVGCVIYYGMPEKDVTKLKMLKCDVLGIFGTKDGFINPQVVAEFEKNMKEAGKSLTVKNYDAVHGFANPSNPKHDKEKTTDANGAALTFLKLKFK